MTSLNNLNLSLGGNHPFGELRSDRLLLRPISLEYTDSIFQEFTPEVTRYMYPKPAETIHDTMRFIRDSIRQWEQGTDLTLVILETNSQEFLGVCAIHRIHTETPELGIWTRKSAWGKGVGREAIHCLKQWVDEHLDYTYLSYPVAKQNTASCKIPESLGGQVVREFQQMNLSGNLLDEVEYRIYR